MKRVNSSGVYYILESSRADDAKIFKTIQAVIHLRAEPIYNTFTSRIEPNSALLLQTCLWHVFEIWFKMFLSCFVYTNVCEWQTSARVSTRRDRWGSSGWRTSSDTDPPGQLVIPAVDHSLSHSRVSAVVDSTCCLFMLFRHYRLIYMFLSLFQIRAIIKRETKICTIW